MTAAPTIFGTKNRRRGERDGFTFIYAGNVNAVKVWRDEVETFVLLPLPADATGWINLTVVFDRAAGVIKQYCNFKLCAEGKLPESLADFSFDADVFTVGNDASGAENEYVNLMYDDFLMYRGALNEDGIAVLREYYNK